MNKQPAQYKSTANLFIYITGLLLLGILVAACADPENSHDTGSAVEAFEAQMQEASCGAYIATTSDDPGWTISGKPQDMLAMFSGARDLLKDVAAEIASEGTGVPFDAVRDFKELVWIPIQNAISSGSVDIGSIDVQQNGHFSSWNPEEWDSEAAHTTTLEFLGVTSTGTQYAIRDEATGQIVWVGRGVFEGNDAVSNFFGSWSLLHGKAGLKFGSVGNYIASAVNGLTAFIAGLDKVVVESVAYPDGTGLFHVIVYLEQDEDGPADIAWEISGVVTGAEGERQFRGSLLVQIGGMQIGYRNGEEGDAYAQCLSSLTNNEPLTLVGALNEGAEQVYSPAPSPCGNGTQNIGDEAFRWLNDELLPELADSNPLLGAIQACTGLSSDKLTEEISDGNTSTPTFPWSKCVRILALTPGLLESVVESLDSLTGACGDVTVESIRYLLNSEANTGNVSKDTLLSCVDVIFESVGADVN